MQEKTKNQEYHNLKMNLDKVISFIENQWKKKEESENKLPGLMELLSQKQKIRNELDQQISEMKSEEQKVSRQLWSKEEELSRLNRDFDNSSFLNEKPIPYAISGLSPEDVKKMVVDAEKSLEEVKQGPKIKNKREEKKRAEERRERQYSKLNSLEGWSNFRQKVIEAASQDTYQIERQLADQPGMIEHVEKILSVKKLNQSECTLGLQKAKLERPSDDSVKGGYEDWKSRLADVLNSLPREMKNESK